MIREMIELIKTLDISKIDNQEEFVKVIEEIFTAFKSRALDDMINKELDNNGWLDLGGQG
ncbi:MAG: hypothetical protein Tp1124SUR1244132_34 [Prokaryotic dsDNA virus sp.]|nr:MAG: hypothetical protein Tp1124SUR1244132_34 [Prokaryotic dsDNA virus sp.]|tara:strand:- start:987 stop:1166 length:180 start_codon:yes stop_codon:yes gene_type:complete